MPKWNKHSIREVMRKDFAFCRRALLVLYRRQTEDEQHARKTKHDNDRGFNQPDARRGSELARRVLAGGLLEPKEVIEVRTLLWKYAGQLARYANGLPANQPKAVTPAVGV
jgi:hypothetical protein